MPESSFYRGLKMIGKKRLATELLTQGSFVKYLLRMITKKPDAVAIAIKLGKPIESEPAVPFNLFFHDKRDDLILTTLLNYFKAIEELFPDQWAYQLYQKPEPTLLEKPTMPVFRRTVGFEALMKVLELKWPKLEADKDISLQRFRALAKELKEAVGDKPMTTEQFSSSSGDATRLAKLLMGDEAASIS
jgi:hypothetical protein